MAAYWTTKQPVTHSHTLKAVKGIAFKVQLNHLLWERLGEIHNNKRRSLVVHANTCLPLG